ncbi:NAD(P)-dependent oxidoreductase [Cellulomonas sp. ATA003]|uniref:NAD-dependent epimerase/dehydratase family protein n=1 Tax=Cellulomonas sp. ATA003 TaxID=3073064 RepID=UPI002873C8A3|nr:NAD(P)-dependent oxidoreductase [Cellulomonas sp. ATA003]WNB86100.1 NAD(P)-dependent oxidoreductase [Cellulomonas sp. ATA003]
MTPRTVLVTGAAGRVGGQLLPGLTDVALRLLDRRAPDETYGGEVLLGELTDRDLLARAMAGVDAVVHLAGEPSPDADWADLEAPNVDGFVALLGAAQEHGVRRVVYASSVHAMGRYEAEGRYPIDATWAPAPCCPYGATKAFDEAIAGVFAHRNGVSTIGLRLGATEPEPYAARQLPGWLGPDDLRQLVVRALEADVHTGVYAAVSANTGGRWSLDTARDDLGYRPALDSADWADVVEDDGVGMTTCRRP